MQFNVIHVVSNLSRVNFGIWNAAIAASSFLEQKYGVKSHVWVCDNRTDSELFLDIPVRHLGSEFSEGALNKCVLEENLSDKTIIVSHGCWLKPTQIGFRLKQMGFPWIYVPHGMLEPWSMGQGRLKKEVYYRLIEKRLANAANALRAVSEKEQRDLERRFKQAVHLIENGVDVSAYEPKESGPETFLFLGRLHHKKGILPLVKAWKNAMRGSNKKLVIAGPDEGELAKILPYLNDDIKYIGPVYGEEKAALLKKVHYFMLPSYSEGFPTSVVEAMGFGLIPMISNGCNFPEVFTQGLGQNIEPDIQSIEAGLVSVKNRVFDHSLSKANHDFIRSNFSTKCLGEKLYTLYSGVLMQNKSLSDGSVLHQ